MHVWVSVWIYIESSRYQLNIGPLLHFMSVKKKELSWKQTHCAYIGGVYIISMQRMTTTYITGNSGQTSFEIENKFINCILETTA